MKAILSYRLINKELPCVPEENELWQVKNSEYFGRIRGSNPQIFPQESARKLQKSTSSVQPLFLRAMTNISSTAKAPHRGAFASVR
jgi:hypothetical protein